MNLNKKFFSKIGFSYLIYAICTIAFPIIIFHIIGNGFEIVNNINFRLIISAICNYILPFPILLFLMKKLESEKLEKESLSITSFLLYFCISFTLMIIGNLIGIGVTSLIGTAIQSDIANPIQTLINSSDILLNLIIISIIGPIFEELLFRKLLIDRTIKYGAKISIILSATLFGLMHGNLNQFFYAFLLGGFFSYIYIKTGKIIYPILLHICLNLMGSVLSLFVLGSANAIAQGTYASFDIGLILIYVLILLLVMIFGLYGLTQYKKAKLTKIRTKIELAKPIRTAFLNYGMACYIGFTILLILYTTFVL
ncbi:MAG: CPBP family intramembrane metalloprotease [Methanobrevibacter sp.]|uniref:CPBP family intramembrane glutamic endopeptidase n=1 Tax=Methanobrevibacter sp. TaxID=66852 RepID=UPI0025F74113|nr:type II CAAX endopeptidase family protein [Methanobrevibacter sp.]MBR3113115.1 CPBP family intramembrane metalloprotease [Methanobrevibacter sp.]MBR6992503.1 CPBP family intramembrane metalloprotease [Methanobrevibacter sp.]